MKRVFQFILLLVIIVSAFAAYFSSLKKTFSSVSLNSYIEKEVSGDNSITELFEIKPVSEQDIIDAIKSTAGPITVSGVHHSLGGKITYPNSLYLDMSHFNQVLEFDTEKKLITVQTGISWGQIQKVIDPHNLSIKIMQDNNDFTVGGSLSVNAHGRFASAGSIINSVKSIRIILPDGKVYDASPEINNALFYGAIGGFGGIGVIVQATLELVDNILIERRIKMVSFNQYNDYVKDNILGDDSVVLQQAILYPPSYESLLDISWRKTDKPLTDNRRLQDNQPEPWWETVLLELKSKSNILHRFQKNLIDPYLYSEPAVVRRNLETSYNLRDSGFVSSKESIMVMQEYLIPLKRFEIFVFNLRDIFSRHKVSLYKILISYVPQKHASLLSGSADNIYSFKIIYLQDKNTQSRKEVESWTEELVRASIESHGAHILPYLIHDSTAQLHIAYPDSNYLFDLKKKADPDDRFKNLFWEQHHHAIYTRLKDDSTVPVNAATD